MSLTLSASCSRDMGTSEDFDECLCLAGPTLPRDIEACQYVDMPKSLTILDPAETVACCPPLSAQPLSAEQAEQVAPLLKALADPVRLRMMSLVASHPGGELCVCDLGDSFGLSQPTISHHLKVLHDA